MDNFYNSVDLTSQAQTYVTGTLRNDGKGNPQVVTEKKKLLVHTVRTEFVLPNGKTNETYT